MSKVKISAEEKKLKKELKAIFNKRIGKGVGKGVGKKAKVKEVLMSVDDGLQYTDVLDNQPQCDEDLKKRTRAYAVSSWSTLLGLKVLSVRGCLSEQRDSKDNGVTVRRILFNDSKTMMAFLGEAQTEGDTRRRVVVYQDSDAWSLVHDNKEDYPEATTDMDGFFASRHKA